MKDFSLVSQFKLYELAEPQAGYFTASQAQSVGFSRPLLLYHTKTGRFKHIRHGVYRLTQFPESPQADLFIAWLQTGPHSIISHESALALYELSDALPSVIHVTIPRTGSRRRSNLKLHTQVLQPSEITHRAGLSITTVARTIADVAISGLATEFVQQAIAQALQRGLVTWAELEQQAQQRQGRGSAYFTGLLQNLKNEIHQ